MNLNKRKRRYERVSVSPVEAMLTHCILAASIVDNSVINSVGQELGPEYDMSFGTDANTGKTFSNEWDMGF